MAAPPPSSLTATSKEVFLSYGREEQDMQRFVLKLKHDLEKNGFTVWLDMEDIPAGCDWHGAIGTGLHQCKALLALITTKYISSRYCASELYTADSDKKHVFPLILEEVDFESTERGRGVKYVISGINWVHFRQGKDDYFSSLLKLMQGMREKGLGPKEGDDPMSPLTGQMAQLHVSPGPPQPYPQPLPYQMVSPPAGPYGYPAAPQQPLGTPQHPAYPPAPVPAYQQQTSPHPLPPAYLQQTPPGPPPQYTDLYPGTVLPPRRQPSPPPAAQDPEKMAAAAAPTAPPPPQGGGTGLPTPPAPAKNPMRIGLKLEADDRRFPYYVCVATIEDMQNDEIKIHFDGWGPEYDYWCSSDSVEIHPIGWCRKHSWELQPPLRKPWNGWNQYLHSNQAEGADDTYFNQNQLAGPGSLCFSPGMRVEAKDRKNPQLLCVATISVIQNGHLLIHFDGWSNRYDYWCSPNSTDIHPPMWGSKNNKKVQPPSGQEYGFRWSSYLHNPDINPAPAHLFTQLQLSDGRADASRIGEFCVGMKLEAKDRMYPTLICVATVQKIRDGQLLIHFDGWSDQYDYWCDPSSTDIHPIRWSQQRGRELQSPKGYGRHFSWDSYLHEVGAVAAPLNAFTASQK